MMASIQLLKGLNDHLCFENETMENSQKLWEPEWLAISTLVDLYERLNSCCRPKNRSLTDNERLSFVFLLTVKNQVIGNTLLMLRARTMDTFALSRLSIEASAFAHRIWENPHLLSTYSEAYPNVENGTDYKAWQPSREYLKEFSTNKIFSGMGDVGERLRTCYAMVCMRACHPGMGILLNLKEHDGQIFLHCYETEAKEWGRNWGLLLAVYFDILKVFLRIHRNQGDPVIIHSLEGEIIAWRDNTLKTLQYPPMEKLKPSFEEVTIKYP